uniref:F-box domain-containing protein n=1 Tax=Leersia perrieri TaxID=77586 RepID=A0A0D9X4D2_9ORYZ
MSNKCMGPTAREASTYDFISSLPDELLHHILSFMTAREAVQTCVLSTRWRHIWQSLHCLNIKASEFTSKVGFVNFMDNLVLRRGDMPLDSLRMSTSHQYGSVSLNHDRANLWIGYALRSNVHELLIQENYYEHFNLDHSSFISSHLKVLCLNYVSISDLFIENLFTGCPALQDLTMVDCCVYATKFSSTSLKNLTFISHSPDNGDLIHDDFKDLVIDTPSLVSLHLEDLPFLAPCLVNVSSVVKAYISLDGASFGCFDMKYNILSALSNVTKLTLRTTQYEMMSPYVDSLYLLQSMVLKRDLWRCETFNNLKKLFVNDWCLNVLLTRLEFWLGNRVTHKQIRQTCHSVVSIKIICVQDDKRVPIVVKAILANANSLPEIVIKPAIVHHMFDRMSLKLEEISPRKMRMSNKRMRPTALEASTYDIISSLPDELLHHILSFMTARQAVQTCVLSSRWRHIWQSLQCLNIKASEFTGKMEFVNFMDNLVLRRGGAPLDSLRMSAPLEYGSISLNHDRANLWVGYALRSNVRELHIQENYHEHFNHFNLDHSSFISFHLKILCLNYVSISALFIEKLLSCCPALQDLAMVDCLVYATKFSSPSLKNLTFTSHTLNNGDIVHDDFQDLVIDTPSLVSLELEYLTFLSPCLLNVSSLEKAYICLDEMSFPCYHTKYKILSALSNVTKLKLLTEESYDDTFHLRQNEILKKDLLRCQTFTNLKNSVDDWCVDGDLRALIYLLRCSPMIEKLTLRLGTIGDLAWEHWKRYLEEDMLDMSFSCERLKKGDKRVPIIVHAILDNANSLPEIRMRPTALEASTYDIISSLPDELLHHILSFMTAREAVQTCVLSSRWRHIWQSLQCFNIKASEFTNKMGFVNFMDNLVLHRGGAPLDSLRMSAPLEYGSISLNHDRANLWVGYALRSNVLELHIQENYHEHFNLDHSSFISSHLKILCLNYVSINALFIEKLLSCCPALQDLAMNLTFTSHTLNNGNIVPDDFKDLVIDTPSLVSLDLEYLTFLSPCLLNVSSVEKAYICLDEMSFPCYHTKYKILSALSNVTKLKLLTEECYIGDLAWEHWKRYMEEDMSDMSFSCEHLKKVKIICMQGDKRVPTIVNAILDNANSLPDIVIRPKNFATDMGAQTSGGPYQSARMWVLYMSSGWYTVYIPVGRRSSCATSSLAVAGRRTPAQRNLEAKRRRPPTTLGRNKIVRMWGFHVGEPMMNQSSKRKSVRDRISALADELLHHVMSFLTAEEAVRTCVLSRRWQNVWASVKHLNADSSKFRRVKSFKKFVDNLFLHRSYVPLDTFCISCWDDSYDDSLDYSDIHRWVCHALKNNAKILDISNYCDEEIFSAHGYTFVSLHLTSLELYRFFVDDRFVEELFPGCPALQDLVLNTCSIDVTMLSSATLKSLTITDPWETEHNSVGFEHLVIDMPNLVSLLIDGIPNRNLHLMNVSSVEEASILLDKFSFEHSDVGCRILSSLSNATTVDVITPSVYEKALQKVLLRDLPRFLNKSPKVTTETEPSCKEMETPLNCKKLRKIEIVRPDGENDRRIAIVVRNLLAYITPIPEITIISPRRW